MDLKLLSNFLLAFLSSSRNFSCSALLFFKSIKNKITQKPTALKAVKKWKGVDLWCDGVTSIMALKLSGPSKDEALPTMLKREKKRNSLPRGMTSEIYMNLVD
jgi:hypothetical protein